MPLVMAFILIVCCVFSFTSVSAQCPNNKILVYKCLGGGRGHCVSKCVNPNNIPTAWSFGCSCLRLGDDQNAGKLSLMAVAPNPVAGSSVIYFYLEQAENVSFKIFDLNGKLVSTLADKMFEEGENEITWNAMDVNAGIYFLRMETAGFSENQKLIVTN